MNQKYAYVTRGPKTFSTMYGMSKSDHAFDLQVVPDRHTSIFIYVDTIIKVFWHFDWYHNFDFKQISQNQIDHVRRKCFIAQSYLKWG